MINIRPIKTEDNKIMQKIIQENLENYHLDIQGTAYFDPQLGELTKYYAELHRAEYWVLTKDEVVIGGIGIASFGDYTDIAEIQKYYLLEKHHGQGYGSYLFQKAKEYAKQQGYKQLYIETTDILAQANKVYEHYGFDKLDKPLDGSEHDAMNLWYLYDLTD